MNDLEEPPGMEVVPGWPRHVGGQLAGRGLGHDPGGCATKAASGAEAFPLRTQFVTVDCGTPSLLAAALPPIDAANLIASTLNSSVYCRFGTDSFLLISPLLHQNSTNFLMYVKTRQGHEQLARRKAAQRTIADARQRECASPVVGFPSSCHF